MWTKRTAEQVISVGNVRDPIAQCFVDRVLQSTRAGVYFPDLRAEQFHAKDIQRLATHVFGAHVDHAIQSEQRADSCGCNAVLSRAGFGDDALLVHAPGEQHLAEGVVDLVCACVKEVFAFEIDRCATAVFRQTRCVKKWCGPACVVLEEALEVLTGMIRSSRLAR